MNLTLVSIHSYVPEHQMKAQCVFSKAITFHRIKMPSSASSTGKTAWWFLDLRASSRVSVSIFWNPERSSGSFLLNIQQMFIVPAYFRRKTVSALAIMTESGVFSSMTGIGNKFFLGIKWYFSIGFNHPSAESALEENGKYNEFRNCQNKTEGESSEKLTLKQGTPLSIKTLNTVLFWRGGG